jgi:hypothetical protein
MKRKIIVTIRLFFVLLTVFYAVSFFKFLSYRQVEKKMESDRANLPSTDLSELRIYGYTIGGVLGEVPENFSGWIEFEDGGSYFSMSRSISAYKKYSDSIISRIDANNPFPRLGLTYKGVIAGDAGDLFGLLGENYIYVEPPDGYSYAYRVSLDKENNIEM